jgi:uncharacterized iron-regulated membrane protein
MPRMSVNKLFRDIHHWGSLALMIPLGVMIVAGVFLMLKKEFDWIQPPSQRSAIEIVGAPETTLRELYEIAAAIPELATSDWTQFDRVDIQPDRGIVKFISTNRWEAQIDLVTMEVLSLEYRRSDLFEQIHDGSFFADWVKLYIFLPAGLLLFVLWLTGIWLFFLPHVKRWQRAKKRAARQSETRTGT